MGEVEFWVSHDLEIVSPVMNLLCLRVEAGAVSDGREGTLVRELLLFLHRQIMELVRLVHDLLHQGLGDSVIYNLWKPQKQDRIREPRD